MLNATNTKTRFNLKTSRVCGAALGEETRKRGWPTPHTLRQVLHFAPPTFLESCKGEQRTRTHSVTKIREILEGKGSRFLNSGNCAVQPSEKANPTACQPASKSTSQGIPASWCQDPGRRIGHGCDGTTGWREMVWKWAGQKGKLLIK